MATDPAAQAASTAPMPAAKPKTLDERVTDLEQAVASLGQLQITHKHDGLHHFSKWYKALTKKPEAPKPEPAPESKAA